jgi:RNA polymerase sigma-70 factor (ECF subfamily)
MSTDPSFEDLMAKLNAGDQSAAAEIFKRYAHRLIGLARTHLDGMMRQKVDPEDVVQSVFRSFFQRNLEGNWNLDDWDSLWSMLTVITVRKCGHRIEHFRALRRDIRREVSASPRDDSSSSSAWEGIAREPTPEEATRLHETIEQLMRELDERDRPILTLALQGFTVQEIADQITRTERTVYRAMERIKKRLLEMRAEDVMRSR